MAWSPPSLPDSIVLLAGSGAAENTAEIVPGFEKWPTNKDLSSMKRASTVGGAFRAGAVSTLLPGSYGALVCENASRDT